MYTISARYFFRKKMIRGGACTDNLLGNWKALLIEYRHSITTSCLISNSDELVLFSLVNNNKPNKPFVAVKYKQKSDRAKYSSEQILFSLGSRKCQRQRFSLRDDNRKLWKSKLANGSATNRLRLLFRGIVYCSSRNFRK